MKKPLVLSQLILSLTATAVLAAPSIDVHVGFERHLRAGKPVALRLEIENQGGQSVQLLNRHWRITDSLGRVQEVRGAGVVGEQPVLEPGEVYQYTSGTPLPTPSGIMVGSYEMENAQGLRFDVAIPAFSLDSPHQPRQIN